MLAVFEGKCFIFLDMLPVRRCKSLSLYFTSLQTLPGTAI
jgi:hypothetical protein